PLSMRKATTTNGTDTSIATAPRNPSSKRRGMSRARRGRGMAGSLRRAAHPHGRRSPPPLADGAEERRAVRERLAAQGRAAPRARFALPPVGVETSGEVTGLAVDVDVERVEARAAHHEGLGHDVA